MNETKLMYDIHEMPPMKKSIVLAFQHLFAMFGATILVPILVNAAAGEVVLTIPVALVTSGIGTLIYILCTKGNFNNNIGIPITLFELNDNYNLIIKNLI